MHLLHRHPLAKGRTKAHGFTLLELAVALTAFALIAGVVTLTMARTQLVNAGARLEKAARAELNALVSTAATAPYGQLATDTFPRPQNCAGAPEKSCVSVLGRTFEVNWAVSSGADLLQASTENPASVTIAATLTLPGNLGQVSIQRTVASPNGGKDGSSGLVRVRVDGASYDGPLYLVQSSGEAVASGTIRGAMATMRADADLCTANSPCRIALGQQGQTSTPTVSMSASSVTGGEAEVTLTADAVVEAGIVLLPRTQVSVGLFAVNSDGRRGQPKETNTVCLYLVFYDGTQQRAVPGCNSADPTTITWDGYVDSAGNELALPQGASMTLTTDNPSGNCSSVGQRGYQNGVWVPSAVCTSWTWGPLTGVSKGAAVNAPVLNASLLPLVAPVEGTSYYRAVWSSPIGQPAAGLPGQGLWESPRNAPPCAATSTCTPVTGSVELESCGANQCNSTAGIAPQISSPLGTGSWKYPNLQVSPNTRTAINLVVTDPDQDPLTPSDRITVSVSSAPAGLERQTAGPPAPVYAEVVNGQTVASNLESGSTVTLYYFGAAAIAPNTSLTVVLSDGEGNTSATTISLWDQLTPYHATAFPLSVGQGETNELMMTVLYQNGNPVESGEVTVTTPAGASAQAVTNDGNGQMRARVSVDNLEKGSHQVTVNLPNDRQVTVPLTVKPRLGALAVELSTTEVNQASSVQVEVQALDRAGEPMNGVDTSVLATREEGTAPPGVYARPAACRTQGTGKCTVELMVEAKSRQGTLVVYAEGDNVISSETTLSVSGTAATITGEPVVVLQTTTTQNPVIATVTITDGDGDPLSGLNLDIGQRPSGLRAEALGASNSQGQVSIALSALPGAQAGAPQLLPMAAAGATGGLLVTIEATAGTLSMPPSLTLPQGGTVATTITAKDAQGQPMPNVTLVVTTAQPVDGPLSVRTSADGTAVLRLSVPTGAPRGTYQVRVSTGSLETRSNVFVSQGVSELIAIGSIARGTTSSTTLVLRDSLGAPVVGRAVTITPRDAPSVALLGDDPVRVSNTQGSIPIELTAAANLSTGVTVLGVFVDGREMSVGVVVQ